MLTPEQVIDQNFLDSRCVLLEVAATLDRYDRAAGTDRNGKADERLGQLYEALRLLADSAGTGGGRCERLLNHFSDPA